MNTEREAYDLHNPACCRNIWTRLKRGECKSLSFLKLIWSDTNNKVCPYHTTEGMPKGYTLIRFGFFKWGWKYIHPITQEPYQSMDKKFTAAGARTYAKRHSDMMHILTNPKIKIL